MPALYYQRNRNRLKLLSSNQPLDSNQLTQLIIEFRIKNFRGIFARDRLPKKPKNIECGIVNLDSYRNPGTHWCAYYYEKNSASIYFDPMGCIPPPKEVLHYLKNKKIIYNREAKQKINTVNCGHLCVEFLIEMGKNPRVMLRHFSRAL